MVQVQLLLLQSVLAWVLLAHMLQLCSLRQVRMSCCWTAGSLLRSLTLGGVRHL